MSSRPLKLGSRQSPLELSHHCRLLGTAGFGLLCSMGHFNEQNTICGHLGQTACCQRLDVKITAELNLGDVGRWVEQDSACESQLGFALHMGISEADSPRTLHTAS